MGPDWCQRPRLASGCWHKSGPIICRRQRVQHGLTSSEPRLKTSPLSGSVYPGYLDTVHGYPYKSRITCHSGCVFKHNRGHDSYDLAQWVSRGAQGSAGIVQLDDEGVAAFPRASLGDDGPWQVVAAHGHEPAQ